MHDILRGLQTQVEDSMSGDYLYDYDMFVTLVQAAGYLLKLDMLIGQRSMHDVPSVGCGGE